jgi:adenosine receptor A2a
MTVAHILVDVIGYLVWGYVFIALVATIIIYIYLLMVAKHQQNKVFMVSTANDGNNGRNQSLQSGQKREQKAARTIGVVVGVFVVCWLPLLVITLSPEEIGVSKVLNYFIFSLALCNSAINPYIYCARNSRYREAFAKLLGRKGNIDISTSGGAGVVPNVHALDLQP